MKIKHYAWQEVDGVERKSVLSTPSGIVINAWSKRINGCTMIWLKEDGWEEVDEAKFVDAMNDVVITPEGHLQLWEYGHINSSFYPQKWTFEKKTMYDVHDRQWCNQPFSSKQRFLEWVRKFERECLIVKKKVHGS